MIKLWPKPGTGTTKFLPGKKTAMSLHNTLGALQVQDSGQGFLTSRDAYNQRFDAIIANFPYKVKCIDDTCIWAESIKSAFFKSCQWLDLCARNGITLNPKMFQFAQDTVDFAGLEITKTNIRPSAKFLDSIHNFPVPTYISGARAWFGQGTYALALQSKWKHWCKSIASAHTRSLFAVLMVGNCVWLVAGSCARMRVGKPQSQERRWLSPMHCTKPATMWLGVHTYWP